MQQVTINEEVMRAVESCHMLANGLKPDTSQVLGQAMGDSDSCDSWQGTHVISSVVLTKTLETIGWNK